MDASVLGILVESWQAVTRAGGSVCLVAPSRQVRKVLATTRMDQILSIIASLDEATSGTPSCTLDVG